MKKWLSRFFVVLAMVVAGGVFSPKAEAGESFYFSVGYSSSRYRCAPPPVYYCPPRPCYPRRYISYSYSYVYSPPVVVYTPPPPPPVICVPRPAPVYYYEGGVFYRY
ncbi:MAG: hypothetical protein NZ483_03810 [Verrucomicrobiae bacterium]|nr:hypothetical protein [Verrucomicrobiae bacterium]